MKRAIWNVAKAGGFCFLVLQCVAVCINAHVWASPPIQGGSKQTKKSTEKSKQTTKANLGQQGKAQKSRGAGFSGVPDPSTSLSLEHFAALWSQSHLYQERLTQLVARSFDVWIPELGGVLWGGGAPAGGGLWVRGGGGGRIAIRLDGLPLLRGAEMFVGEQSLSGLAPWDLKKISLVRGPASIFFGDHAMTGALLLTTEGDGWEEQGHFRSWRWGLWGEGQYNSGAQGLGGYARAWVGMPIFGARLSGGYIAMQELRGSGGEILPESGYAKGHVSARIRFSSPHRRWENRLFYTAGWLRDAVRVEQFPPRGDRLRWDQQQHLAYVDSRLFLPFLNTRLRGMFGVQYLEASQRHEYTGTVGGGVLGWREESRPHLRWDGLIHGESRPWSILSLRYGIEFSTESLEQKELGSGGSTTHVESQSFAQARQSGLAFFLSGRIALPAGGLRVLIEGGMRLHNHWRDITGLAPVEPMRWAKVLYASHLGVSIGDPRVWSVRLFFSDGFRTPSVAEMSHQGPLGQAYVISNPDLEEERTRAIEGRFSLRLAERLQTSLRFFLQAYSGWYALQPATLAGQDMVDGLPVLQFRPTDEVVMLGIEATVAWRIIWGWSLRGDLAWMEEMGSRQGRSPGPLWPAMPSWTGRILTRYDWKGWGGIEVVFEGSAGREASWAGPWKGGPTPSTSWWTLHVRADLRLLSWLQLRFAARNLLDRSYIPFPSRFPVVGRDIRLALQFAFP
ncbi:MAG: TonB-dependent receptor [Myxococcales bacterium]|nr:TonB-dependent receptor [Myxococcales bacterium]